MKPAIILTFDLEEFDLPLEYAHFISEDEQMAVANQGLQRVIALLDHHNVKATFFITGNFCAKNPQIVAMLAQKHEIASHAYYHSGFDEEFIKSSKAIIEKTTGRTVAGFRMPLLQPLDYEKLSQAGYTYDSSINPTFLPGRYNHFGVSRKPFTIPNTGIIEFPVSVSPLIRFPLFWLSFKNLPFWIYSILCRWTLAYDYYLHLYFHPWEFAQIGTYPVPNYIKNPNGDSYAKKFDKLLSLLKRKGEFVTASQFLHDSMGNKS